jgi:hypothetical protein
MATAEHLSELQKKHASLEEAIDEESHRPAPDTIRVSDLKKQKLRIKEEISRLEVHA